MEDGLIDAELGGHVVKKRVALPGRGKRGGSRTLVVYQQSNKVFFVYGFAKNERANISIKQLKNGQQVITYSYDAAGNYKGTNKQAFVSLLSQAAF